MRLDELKEYQERLKDIDKIIENYKNVKSGKTKDKLLNIAELYGNNKYGNVLRLIINTDMENHLRNSKVMIEFMLFAFLYHPE